MKLDPKFQTFEYFVFQLFKHVLICLAALQLLALSARAETVLPANRSVDSPHAVGSEYQYRTGRFVTPPEKEKKIWDYLSFFSIPSDPDKGHLFPAEESTELRMRARELTRQLVTNARESFIDEYALSINTFVNLNNVYKTSSLGRAISEQLIGELQMAGAEVIDVRKSTGLMIHEKHGEYGLSREMKELSYIHETQAMVVGTYTYANGQIIVNARVLRNSDGLVLSNASLAFDLDPFTRQMLADESMPASRGGTVTVESIN